MKPIGWTAVQGERSEPLGAQRAGEQRVVADLGVGVERQVVGGEADVGVEQELEAALQRGVDRPGTGTPEEPVVDDQQLRALGGGQLEQLRVR